jgi:hypothetical protein
MFSLRPALFASLIVFIISTGFALFAALLEGFFGVRSSNTFWECLAYVVFGSEALSILIIILAAGNPKSMTIDKDL